MHSFLDTKYAQKRSKGETVSEMHSWTRTPFQCKCSYIYIYIPDGCICRHAIASSETCASTRTGTGTHTHTGHVLTWLPAHSKLHPNNMTRSKSRSGAWQPPACCPHARTPARPHARPPARTPAHARERTPAHAHTHARTHARTYARSHARQVNVHV